MASPQYRLVYWPGIPGRGEHIRLVFEETSTPYTDTATTSDGLDRVLAYVQGNVPDDNLNPPPLAPPILQHLADPNNDTNVTTISQTSNILLYLATHLPPGSIAPDPKTDPNALFYLNSLALTALDGLSNEPHDCHHPIASGLYYEDQKPESLRKADNYVRVRLPKFLGYFERVLGSGASGGGKWLYGGKFSFADLVLFQCLDGVKFMFPKAVSKYEREGAYAKVFALYQAVSERPKIAEYLKSSRRQKYSDGIYRYYEELDIEP
ncbi:glutathione S-transferase [Chaetomium sp. MPI-SDFR-AT-0129]|nr:glutathione S-transferase [Chaetomium sp. MPI-SDFR-AT-0129]